MFVTLVMFVMLADSGYAMNLEKAKVYFLNGDYDSAIVEGEKVLADYNRCAPNLDELYYILGLAYLKDGNYLRASDIFEIIIREFRNSALRDEAELGLADTYFLRGDYDKAELYYKELINNNPRTKLQAVLYYRIGRVALKKGNTPQAKEYLDKLRQDFPLNPEIRLDRDIYALSDIYYTVQVGSFSKSTNAKNLTQKLTEKGYPAYVEEAGSDGNKIYRVRVGKFQIRQQAQGLENKLSQEGYPTKIFP